jgi:cytochrome P450
MLKISQGIESSVKEALAFKGRYSPEIQRERKTIVEDLRDNEKLPPSEKTLVRLTDEAFVALIAGSESPAKIMALIAYHLMQNPEKSVENPRTHFHNV